MLEQVSCQELAPLRISSSCLAVFDGRQYLRIKDFFKEIPGIDGSWRKSVHPSLSGSSQSNGEDAQHDSIV
ncbi:hypothetical protein Tco_0853328 [Tanacetum coccineum]